MFEQSDEERQAAAKNSTLLLDTHNFGQLKGQSKNCIEED